MLILTLLLGSLPLFTAAPVAQLVGGQWDTLHQFDGAGAGDSLGVAVAGAGDVDGDGFDDVIVGADRASPGGLSSAGSAYVRSGSSGNLLWQFNGSAEQDRLGFSVDGAGDVDGDGFDDVIVGAIQSGPGPGSAFVYSGATGALIWRFNGTTPGDSFGIAVAGVGDLDGDGVGDLMVGAWGADPAVGRDAGSVFLYSGATGSLIRRLDGTAPGERFGSAVSAAGDVDGDGVGDLIVGAYYAEPGGRLFAGSAFVHSGATGALIWRLDGTTAGSLFGFSVAGAGDVDGDGLHDLIIGVTYDDPNGVQDAGSAVVISGASGTPLHRFHGEAAYEILGFSVSGAGDLDGDGYDDLLVGAPGARMAGGPSTGSALVYSGATGGLIWRFDGAAAGEGLGSSVALAGDVNGDGTGDLIVGVMDASPGGLARAGSALVFGLDPFLRLEAAELSASSGIPVRLGIDFPAGEAGFRYAILASAAGTGPTVQGGLEIPLSPDRLLNQMLAGWIPGPLQNGRGALDPQGDALAVVLSSPALAPYVGRSVHLAAVSYDPATMTGRLSSIARRLTIVP